jgi:hypothetical protein
MAAVKADWQVGSFVRLTTVFDEVGFAPFKGRARLGVAADAADARAHSPLFFPAHPANPFFPPQKTRNTRHRTQEVAGTVFTFDAATDSLVLKEAGTHGGVHNVRILRASAVRSVAEAAPPPDAAAEGPAAALARSALAPLPHVDPARAREREARALRQAQADLAKVGVGVTREAQALFDALAKTMPCEWRQQQQRQQGGAGAGAAAAAAAAAVGHGEIAVLECVVVRPPYTPADCAALPGPEAEAAAGAGALERVRKVLKAARERLGLLDAGGGGGGGSAGGGGAS